MPATRAAAVTRPRPRAHDTTDIMPGPGTAAKRVKAAIKATREEEVMCCCPITRGWLQGCGVALSCQRRASGCSGGPFGDGFHMRLGAINQWKRLFAFTKDQG